METRIEGFPPIAHSDARILILGSMPGVESLRQGFYYAHPRNAFWRILSAIFQAEVPDTVDVKKELLYKNKIALWDTAQSCVRQGSLDSDIRHAVANDFSKLYVLCPNIEKILFNGATAETLYRRLVGEPPCIGVRMPSTSPAFTMPFEQKCALWRKNLEVLL